MSAILQGNAVRILTPLHDWTMGNGNAGYIQQNAAIAQQIDCRILQVFNECFWDMAAGINWFAFLSGGNPQALSLAIQSAILNTPNSQSPLVTGINAPIVYDLNPIDALFSVNWDVSTVFSKTLTGSTLAQFSGG